MNSLSRTERRATARDGTGIAYAVTPAARAGAPRVALVHSLALDQSFWNGVVAAIGGEMEVLALDCRGHGASDRAPGPYTVEQMADDLADVLDHAGWADAMIAGCSMGGCVALAFAARHPVRTTALVAMDTTAWYGPDAPEAWARRADRAREGGMAALLPFQHERWLSPAFRADHPEVEAAADAVFLRNDIACYAATCQMLGAADLREAIGAITAPTTVLVGSDDTATPPAMAEEIVRRIPGAHLRLLEGARHLTPLECPNLVAHVLKGVAS